MTSALTGNYREEHDIVYYEQGWQGSGDCDYRAERCKLDIYYPADEPDFITVIWFHGGGLQAGEKSFPAELLNKNIAVVAPNYRLSSARAKCPDYLEDAAAAVAWVFNHISRYGGSAERIYISGGSGGGYLAAMLGLAPQYLARHGISNRRLGGVMPISGQMTTHFQIVNERAGIISLTPPTVPVIDEYAPIHYISKDTPPMAFYVGDPGIEWPGRPEENKLLAALLTRVAMNPQVECLSLPGFDHGDIYPPALLLMLKKITAMELKKFVASGPRCAPRSIRRTPCPQAPYPSDQAWAEADWAELVSRGGRQFTPLSRFAFLYDSSHLYFRFIGDEPHPEKMVQNFFGHDASCLWEGDCVDIYLAPNPAEPDKAFQLIVAPDGSIYDADFGAFGGSGPGWDPPGVRAQSHVGEKQWTVDLAIPLADIGLTAAATAMAGNVYRRRLAGGCAESANWSPTMVYQNHFPELYGKLNFSR